MMRSADQSQILKGARVLVVEDELLIALDMEMAFRAAGAEVVGPCYVLPSALRVARNEPLSLAVLDIRLDHVTTKDVSDVLNQRGIPFFFYSGQSLPAEMQDNYGSVPFVGKPATQEELVSVARAVLSAASTAPDGADAA